MEDGRKFRKPGEILLLGQTEYRLESVEGYGGSTVVYRASYEDGLNRDCRHSVLIKELFPWDFKGEIYRGGAGEICCRGDGVERMEQCRRNFYRGNEANLRLLEHFADRVSGNINSCCAYGTYYSVLFVHGGESLARKLERRERWTLRQTAEVILKILDALECFHESGLLHLDISPDNLLLLKDRALLIDYNSVFVMDGPREEQSLSRKEGYTAPEVRLRELRKIGPASDLYAVCAVWFAMLTGRRLSDEEIVGRRLKKSLAEAAEVFAGEPVTAVHKAVQILTRGLHVLAGKRWQSTRELREEVAELLLRIDGGGVTHSALWEGSRRALKKIPAIEEGAFKRRVCVDPPERGGNPDFRSGGMEGGVRSSPLTPGGEISAEELADRLRAGGLFFLTAPGGMGKTTFLLEFWKKASEVYRRGEPVTVYIPLADYQTAGRGETHYLRKRLLEFFGRKGAFRDTEGMSGELKRQLAGPDGWRLILLLDGLNEAGTEKKLLLKEIGEFAALPLVSVLLTGREETAASCGLKGFCGAGLLPLTDEEVGRALDGAAVSAELRELLKNPMMLALYHRIREMADEGAAGEGGMADAVGEEALIGCYLDGLWEKIRRADAGNETEELRCHYVFRHFLPEVAREMKRRKKTVLTAEELCALAVKSYHNLGRREFGMAFPEYLGASRRLLEGFRDGTEWFDYAVTEQLLGRLPLLKKSGGGNYGLVHDDFIGFLAGRAAENRRVLLVCRRKAHRVRRCAIFAAVLLAAGAGAAVWDSCAPGGMFGQRRYQQDEVLYQLGRNLGTLGLQMEAQFQVLDRAASREVLEGDAEAVDAFVDWTAHKRREMEGHRFERSKSRDALEELEAAGADLPFGLLGELLERTYEMDLIMEAGLSHLEDGLKREVLSYTEREELVVFYRDYLEACAQVTCRELNLVLVCLDEEAASELLAVIGQTAVLGEEAGRCPYEGKSRKVLETELAAARARLKTCRNDMKRRNYVISLPNWQ